MKKDEDKSYLKILRQKAEEEIKSKTGNPYSILSEAENIKLFHELELHKIELDMQNEELIASTEQARLVNELSLYKIELDMQNEELVLAKAAADLSAEKYTNLFDFAPSGYVTLSSEGAIMELNFCAANMLGKERLRLIKSKFNLFISVNTRQVFNSFLKKIYAIETKQTCEVIIVTQEKSSIHVKIEGVLNQINNFCLLTIVDITDLKLAEEELIHSERRMSDIIFSMSDWVWEIDENGVYTYSTEKLASVLGFSHEEIIGKTPFDFMRPDEVVRLTPLLSEIIAKKKKIINLENWNIAKDGKEICILTNGVPIFDKARNLIGYRGVDSDITERKLAEDKLRKSEARFKNMFENHNSVMLLIEPDSGKIINANIAASNYYGYTISELRKMSIHEINILNTVRIKEEISKAETCEKNRFHFNHKLSSGEIRNVEVHSSPIDYSNKTILFSIIHDITDRRNAEEKLKDIFQRLLLATSSGKLGVWEWNVNDNILIWDDRMYELYSLEKDTFLNNIDAWFSSIHPEDKQRINVEFNSALNGDIEFNSIFRILHPDSTVLYIEAHGAVIRDVDGKATRMIGIHKDITDKKLAEFELEKAKEKAEESDRLKSAFLANMSHEIRTPMNGILGFADLLKMGDLTIETQEEYIDMINESGVRMLNIINDIVDISKIESGLMKLDIKESDIIKQLEYIYTFFKKEAEDKNIKLILSQELQLNESIINTDREKVFAILINLVKNAIKYSHKGSIVFGCKKKEQSLEFFVQDTGVGIKKDQQVAIFDRFIQAYTEDGITRQGTGLGLSITKAYVEMMGGKIWVESQEGVGSKFYFTLPCNIQIEKQEINKDLIIANNENIHHCKLKILIVDDDKVSLKLLSKLLEPYGKEILTAESGTAAIVISKKRSDIDLILMDVEMPGILGYEAVKLIRMFNKNVIIIAQTAFSFSDEHQKAIDSGCDGFISKPIKREDLIQLIQKNFG